MTSTSNNAAEAASDPKKPYGDVQYADPGYQKDGKKRYPVDTKAHVRSAWSYVNQKDNASNYTADQLSKVKSRIKAAAKRLGIEISSDEAWLIQRGLVEEFYGDDLGSAKFCVSVSNGAVDVMISSYCVDPADLDVVARAAMDGACKALAGLDPDADGDIDVPGEGPVTASVSGTTWQTGQTITTNTTNPAPIETSPDGGGDATPTHKSEQEPTVSEATNEATTTAAPDAPTRNLTDADVSAIGEAFAAALKANTPAPAPAPAPTAPTPATETAPAPTTESTTKVDEATALKETVATVLKETVDGLRTDLTKVIAAETDKVRTETREALQQVGITPPRTGYRVHENNGTDTDKTPGQLFDDRANVLLGNWARTPVPHTGTGIAATPVTQAAPAAQ